MRTLFLILLGLSFTTIAQGLADAHQQPQLPAGPHPEKAGPTCDPNVTSKMPETFY